MVDAYERLYRGEVLAEAADVDRRAVAAAEAL
jgi:hypothetical protein